MLDRRAVILSSQRLEVVCRQNQFVVGLIGGDDAWLGGTDRAAEGAWIWEELARPRGVRVGAVTR